MTKRRPPGDPEQGTVIILVAVLWTTLFGFAALAVDIGYLYQAKRSLQAAADAAVMAGLPRLAAGSQTQATATATSMATAGSGYPSSAVSTAVTATRLTVSLTVTEPRFFAGILGFPAKTLIATAVGQTNPALPAVFVGGTACPGGTTTGLQLNGDGFNITGNLQSNSAVNFYTGGSNTTTGSITYNPACGYAPGYGNPAPTGGSSPTGGSLPSPLSYTLSSFTCTVGSTTSGGGTTYNVPSVGGVIPSGTYCSAGDINLSGSNLSGTVTLVAGGKITMSSSTATLTAFSNNILAYSNAVSTCSGTTAISMGSSSVTLTGNFDAPNGCINASGTAMTINGSLIGNEVQIGVGTSSVINATAGGGGGGYFLYQ